MNKKRSCKRCSFSLSDMDPHSICKSCRQPDPQMFYCSEDDCEACSVIKVYKPLDLFLRKQELENLAKKLNPMGGSQVKERVSVPPSRKLTDLFMRNSGAAASFTSEMEDRSPEFQSDILSSLLKGIHKEKNESLSPFNTKLETSHPSTSGSNEPENFRHLENRLFERIMSTLRTSLSSDSKASSPEVPSPKGSPSVAPAPTKKCSGKISGPSSTAPGSPRDSIDLDRDEEEFEDILLRLFATLRPDALAKGNRGLKENDYIFKVSSRVSDILSNSTVLSSPSQASKLCQELNTGSETSYWPPMLNASDLLHSNFSQLPSMKLHPKIRHMHTLLFGKLNPTLPQELMGKSFTLPAISLELKNECLFARDQLQRLLLVFSVLDYFSREKAVKDNPSFVQLIELVLNLLKISVEKQANFVGLLIQEIRRDLLSDAECKEPDAVSKLIMGPVHQSQFFGPYVKELQNMVGRKGSAYCLTSKSECANVNVFKLPVEFKDGESAVKFLSSLRFFYESNSTKDKDKVAIFESLLPTSVVDRLSDFVKPKTIGEKSFDELADIFEKSDENHCLNYLIERRAFSETKVLSGQSIESYAEQLEIMLPRCMYGANSREMLRDQFIFGLLDETLQQYLMKKFSWSFEECVEYAINRDNEEFSWEPKLPGGADSNKKVTFKRKSEDNKDSNPLKKVKSQDSKIVVDFYNNNPLNSSKIKTVKVSSLQQWMDLFGFEVKYSYDVYCPWTGQILRS